MCAEKLKNNTISYNEFSSEVLEDYKLAWISRYTSIIGRKEVLNGKAKFGIFGDGKELVQIVMAKFMKKGDFRSGYYRDLTLALATKNHTVKNLFAQLYADPSFEREPSSSGRMMNGHFSSKMIDKNGNWENQMEKINFPADISPTAAQVLKAVGLALASKLYRNNKEIKENDFFTNNGDELVFTTIGDASTSEGFFFEAVNSSCVMQIPIIFNVYDDGYGISVPKELQTAKGSISNTLSGFQIDDSSAKGLDIYTAKGWDYTEMINVYNIATSKTREMHSPSLIHIVDLTQPQGHSTSGSHERYKSEQRMKFEEDFDCLVKFEEWIISSNIASKEDLDSIKKEALDYVILAKNEAFNEFKAEIIKIKNEAIDLINLVLNNNDDNNEIIRALEEFKKNNNIQRKDILKFLHQTIRIAERNKLPHISNIIDFYNQEQGICKQLYNSNLYLNELKSLNEIEYISPIFSDEKIAGHEIINIFFDNIFQKNDKIIAFGEDVGKIGDVNQGFAMLQEKYGELRVFDTGIREATIIGQGQGLSFRGFRPIAEIQYLDYLLYAIVPLSDDISTLTYRTNGTQKSPIIVRTRGHRLEGIWHSGSPMGMIINSLRGMIICVPRNLTVAAGMYNTLLSIDQPALVIEPLNGYRFKEIKPLNIGQYNIELGKIEVLEEGSDITIVSYGSTIKICQESIEMLKEKNISVELIDIQTLIPFDLKKEIVDSLQKTNRLLVVDEDVYGGASAYILTQIIENQDGYKYLDSKPSTMTSKDHRPAYGTDGDYFSKPNAEMIYDKVIEILSEANPNLY